MKLFILLIIIFCCITTQIIPQAYEKYIWRDSVETNININQSAKKISSINLTTSHPIDVMVVIMGILDNPTNDNSWPKIENPKEYPNELFPLLGTFWDKTLLRKHIEKNGPIDLEDWIIPQMQDYFDFNSNGKFKINLIVPKTSDGKLYITDFPYEYLVSRNENSKAGMIMRYQNWKIIAENILSKIAADHPGILSNVKLLNLVYLVTGEEYSRDNYVAYSPDVKFSFTSPTGQIFYNGFVTTSFSTDPILHEIFHRVGSIVGTPDGFEGLPDRTTSEFYEAPQNMTWGHDIMCNKGQIPSENALFGVPPMLTTDRMFFEWIEPEEVITISFENREKIKLIDVNSKVPSDLIGKYFRAAKIMIHENFDGDLDEYFLLEFRNGSGFDRNFYNIYETNVHTGMLIWHIKENTNLLNRERHNDHFYDLEVAVPYNGWLGTPVPNDDFPRYYSISGDAKSRTNDAGDYDYLDDSSSPPYLPDGGVHRWELSDTTHPQWRPYYLRRNTLTTDFFTDKILRGNIVNRITNTTRPSTKDWAGHLTDIAVYNIKQYDDYMTFDVTYDGAVLSVDKEINEDFVYTLSNNYPNPFNPETTIEYNIPSEKSGTQQQQVKLVVYDILGNQVSTLINAIQSPGKYKVVFNGTKLSSGIYYYRITAGSFVKTNKMILVK